MTIHIDKKLLDGWNPRYSFVMKLAGRTGIEVADFFRGIETGDFLRKDRDDYTGLYTTKEDLRAYLYARGFSPDSFLESPSMATYLRLQSYAGPLGLEVSELLEEAGASGILGDMRFTEVGTDPDDAEYYTTALDGLVLPFLYMLQATDHPISYLETGYGKGGWNPTLETLCGIAQRSGIGIVPLIEMAKSGDDISIEPGDGNGIICITLEDVRKELLTLLGHKKPRELSSELGLEEGKIYQDLRRKRNNSMTILSILTYLEAIGLTLPDFFRLLEERKKENVC